MGQHATVKNGDQITLLEANAGTSTFTCRLAANLTRDAITAQAKRTASQVSAQQQGPKSKLAKQSTDEASSDVTAAGHSSADLAQQHAQTTSSSVLTHETTLVSYSGSVTSVLANDDVLIFRVGDVKMHPAVAVQCCKLDAPVATSTIMSTRYGNTHTSVLFASVVIDTANAAVVASQVQSVTKSQPCFVVVPRNKFVAFPFKACWQMFTRVHGQPIDVQRSFVFSTDFKAKGNTVAKELKFASNIGISFRTLLSRT